MARPGGSSARSTASSKARYFGYQHFKAILEDLNFVATFSDDCVFTRQLNSRLQIITIYVDDVLICASEDEEIVDVFPNLHGD